MATKCRKSIKSNLVIKPVAVGLQHQMGYWLFDEVNMADLLKGKNNYYFSEGWTKARCCENKLNADSLDKFIQQLKELQTLMLAKGKFLKILIPPSKEEIFSCQLPDLLAQENPNNDYYLYIKKYEVIYDDLLLFYQNLIKSEKLPVYSKTSVH